MHHDTQTSHLSLTKDVLGVVATLGKVDDDNLSRSVGICLLSVMLFCQVVNCALFISR
jgi:hypothetical protein